MPSVSKKFVTAPMPISISVGNLTSVAGEGAAGPRRTATTAALHPATNNAVSAPSAPKRQVIGLIPMSARLRFDRLIEAGMPPRMIPEQSGQP